MDQLFGDYLPGLVGLVTISLLWYAAYLVLPQDEDFSESPVNKDDAGRSAE